MYSLEVGTYIVVHAHQEGTETEFGDTYMYFIHAVSEYRREMHPCLNASGKHATSLLSKELASKQLHVHTIEEGREKVV